jgi:hypothetical protein
MPNSSSSKYVKRRRHRHTKSRRHAKKYTIKKVMRGCSSKQYGGAPLGSSNVGGNVGAAPHGSVELSVAQGTTPHQAATQQASAANLLNLQKLASAGNPVATTSPTPINYAKTSNGQVQGGGYKSKHRRHRYKKSIGRRGRSRRFRGSRK